MGPRISLSRPYFDAQEQEAVRRVLESGWVVQGEEVEEFEAEIARLHGVRHCVAVSSGTAALHVCYLALGIGPGHAVFVPSFAWPSAANMSRLVGAEPIFVDVLESSYNVDPADLNLRIERCIKNEINLPKVVVPVHEFGLAADLAPILEVASKYSMEVIEDAACALGATYRSKPVGSFGRLGVFSFHPRKSITTGEGGAIVTNDSELAERCRSWRNHGQRFSDRQRQFLFPGPNYRMTEMQAAIGRAQLGKFERILAKRRALVDQYLKALNSCSALDLPVNHPKHTWQTFMTCLKPGVDRASVLQKLAESGIEAGPGSVAGHLGLHFQPQPELPISTSLDRHGLALPLHAGLSSGEVQQVVDALLRALNSAARTPDVSGSAARPSRSSS
jgi:perosamine synthetase